ncbi:hypothetical protein D9615_006416 [Tricholomella constricta]|uniref:Uncharacterized protein n=1 Tax=Tricholomella constricta TaxID=117010 RepID=A0A8H5H5P4_9AGAR|nr:hypothetical protein D9615_006416 [Tricholomella constricta]
MQYLWSFFFFCTLSTSFAVLVNVTIDDTLGDSETGTQVTYIGAWNDGPSCARCTATQQLDRNKIYNGTWRDSSANKQLDDTIEQLPLAFVPFHGSAVYVYCIISDKTNRPNGNADMTFLIDGQPAGNYTRQPTGEIDFEYNVLVFAHESLTNEGHTLTIQNGHVGGQRSLVLLDYIVYSYENGLAVSTPTSTQPLSPHTPPASESQPQPENTGVPAVSSSGKIVGGVLGSIGGVLLVLLAFLWKRQRGSKGSINLTPPPALPSQCTLLFKAKPIQNWLWKPNEGTMSRFSFNPSLFVEPVMDQHDRTIVSHAHPPPVTTVLPIQPVPPRPDSTRPLHPNREATPSPSLLDPRSEQRQPLSILEWQRRTQREADATPPRFDVSDHEMSSYYDFSSDGPDSQQPPPRACARPTPRRFTVVNN